MTLRRLCFLTLSLLPALVFAVDAFEPDDSLPFLGATMDGAIPDFTDGTSPDLFEGDVPVWLVSDRTLAGPSDRDWMIFLSDRYPYCPDAGQIRITGSDPASQANLQVEVLGYNRDIAINPSSQPLVLQSCGASPVGSTVISLGQFDLRSFYRVRSCNSAPNVHYEFEYRFTSSGLCFAVSNIFGTVADVRNGRKIPGAYVYSNDNSVTFSSPDDGTFSILVLSGSNIVLDFLVGGLESAGPVNIGPVAPGEFVDDVALLAQPPGLIFFGGFEN